MNKIIFLFALVIFTACSDNNRETVKNKAIDNAKMNDNGQKIIKLLCEIFPKNGIKTQIIDTNLYIIHYDSMSVWGLSSYEHIVVEQMVGYLDTLLKPIKFLKISFKVFDNEELTQDYILSITDINKIIQNHKNNHKLLAYKHYLTNTMNGKECHDLLSALYGIAQAYKDNSLKTDFYAFALMYAEAKQKGITEKENFYRSVMDELYDGFSDPKTIREHNVTPEHIKELIKILE